MESSYYNFLQQRIDKEGFDKLKALKNSAIIDFVGEYVELCNPASVFVRTDRADDAEYIRKKAIDSGEEKQLAVPGHTAHFDGFYDQARDKKNTKYLVENINEVARHTNHVDRKEGLSEIKGYLKDIMQDKEMRVAFFCLGPVNSEFSLPALQITDSFYVSHSEDLLYRPGYEMFKKTGSSDFFKFVHSAGQLDNNKVSINTNKRRVYIDLRDNIVFSSNTQYAGNTVGLKKLALRLSIKKASREGWLAEHMFVVGVNDFDKKKAYFCGAYPSMCGKTSTSMVRRETIIGDDIAYLRQREGKVYGVNVERGMFGIIKDVNTDDDPILFKALSESGERIFSNILIDEANTPYWVGKQKDMPHKGINFAGAWYPGVTDDLGEEIPLSHKNARYTLKIKDLENVDENLDNPVGVEVKGIIYGGRDSDTCVPVEEAFSWQHGIITKAASLESETTAATLGQEGIRVFNPMSNMDFLSIPLHEYINLNLDFGKGLQSKPVIFSVNYFLRDEQDRFLTGMEDKRVWLKWMRIRVDRRVKALRTPTGFIPKYADLKDLFKKVLDKGYSEQDYINQFTVRARELLEKNERIKNIYSKVDGMSPVFYEELENQEKRLLSAREKFGDYIQPDNFQEE